MKTVPHEVTWTPDRISAYWDYISSNKYLSSLYFTKQLGRAVVKDFISSANVAGKDILDFGCGPGNLFVALNDLVPAFNYYGMDFSQNSIEQLKANFSANKNFKDAFSIKGFPLNHNRLYDYIICCEVIEHLDDKTLDSVTKELYSLLKPGGTLYVTTPNNEDLEAAKTMCPECGCVFHKWQHMRSWNRNSIADHFTENGFRTKETKTLNFENNPVVGFAKDMIKSVVLKRAPRNLVYSGTKPA